MTLKLANFVALFLLALVTGVFWGTWFTLTRSIETFSPAEFHSRRQKDYCKRGVAAVRERWQSFHTTRTFASVASFGSLAIAIIFPKSKT
jgi:hypothetical protein